MAGTCSPAELTCPIRAGEVKKGCIVLLKGAPCKVVSVSKTQTGKHGHAKVNLVGICIFSAKKFLDASPASHSMEAPFVERATYTLIDVSDDGFCSIMDAAGETRQDLECPGDDAADKTLGERIRNAMDAGEEEVTVVVTKAMGTEAITDFCHTRL